MANKNDPVGFFDSGLGGISVLREAVKLLPHEDYIYFGDSANAPYGTKPVDKVRVLCMLGAEFLVSKNVKAIVIACNTATSAGIDFLREKYPDIPVIGIEPAIKPAVEKHSHGRVLIMATEMTLKEEKFVKLWDLYRDRAEIFPVPCKGLMEFIEKGDLESTDLNRYLVEKLSPYMSQKIDAIVLGCTHYPFVRPVIQKIVGNDTDIIDGGSGVAHQLYRKLQIADLLNDSYTFGKIDFFNSSGSIEMIKLSEHFLSLS